MRHLVHERVRRLARTVLVGLLLGGVALPSIAPETFLPVAMADDDDDDGGGRGGRYGGRGDDDRPWFRRPARRVVRRPARPVQPPPAWVQREIVAMGLGPEGLTELEAAGYAILEQATLPALGQSAVKLSVPAGTGLEAARELVRSLSPSGQADFNHLYRPEQASGHCEGDACWARGLVGWPRALADASAVCEDSVSLGMIDTGINTSHEALADRGIELLRIGEETDRRSGLQHGTAVAALLVGSPSSRVPGLLPGAKLHAVDAFSRVRGGDRAEAYDLVAGIDHLLQRGVSVINLSLSGAANDLLKRAIELGASDHDAIFVAAVGNDGPRAKPLYPAAYDGVIGVTAVDRRKRPYRRANRGAQVDFAAPGVAVWTAASISGARTKTGTSFAAPFVSSALALLKAANPDLGSEEIVALLARTVEDLGEPGKDDVFGMGLIDAAAICPVKD